MSYDWMPECATCGLEGPRIRSAKSGTVPSPVNRVVLPAGSDAVGVPPHGSAVVVADRPSRWQWPWARLRGRTRVRRWRHQPHDSEGAAS